MSKHNEYAPHEAKIFTPAFLVVLFFVAVGFAIIVYRFMMGLGYVSNLSDGYPWGIWLAYDVATGSAIACGGYVIAITVYIMNKFKYHPMVRSAVLASMFGYGLAGLSVMVDIGRPWNSIYFFTPSNWQPNSVLFEVALCIMAYTFVLLIEFLPAVFERFSNEKRFPKLMEISKKLYKGLDKILFLIIALGVTLPTMHQSSLGSLLIITGYKLNALWQTQFLPLLFLSNAILMGFSVVVFETVLSTKLLKRPFEVEVVSLARVIPYVIAFWITIRLISVTTAGGWAYAFTSGYGIVFWFEMLLLLIPCYIIFATKFGKSQSGLFVSAVLLMLGAGLYRFSVYIIGFNPGPGWYSYFPSINEFFITFGIIGIEVGAYILLIKLLPVLPNLQLHKK